MKAKTRLETGNPCVKVSAIKIRVEKLRHNGKPSDGARNMLKLSANVCDDCGHYWRSGAKRCYLCGGGPAVRHNGRMRDGGQRQKRS